MPSGSYRERAKVSGGPLWWDCLANRRGSFGSREPSIYQGRGQASAMQHRAYLQLGAVALLSSSHQLLPFGHDWKVRLDILGNLLSKPVHWLAEWLGGEVVVELEE